MTNTQKLNAKLHFHTVRKEWRGWELEITAESAWQWAKARAVNDRPLPKNLEVYA